MMRTIRHTRQFKKDFKKSRRRGKDITKLKRVIELLARDESLPPQYHDHALSGNLIGTRECHIEPDWLLIYAYEDPDELILIRLGSHADLFRK